MYSFVMQVTKFALLMYCVHGYMLSFNISGFIMLIVAGWIYKSSRPVHKVHWAVPWPSCALHKPSSLLLTN